MAMSTSSRAPRRMNSGLPPMNSKLSLTSQVVAVFDFDVLFGWYGHQRDTAGELFKNAFRLEGGGDTEHHSYLAVMSAGVRGGRVRVGVRVSEHFQ